MPARPNRPGAPPSVKPPELPGSLEQATVEDHQLEDEATFHRLSLAIDMSDRSAEAVHFDQCRFDHADLTGTTLRRAGLTDCLIERTNLANLRTEKSSLHRVRLTGSRLTGLHWIDGILRDVTFTDCRADLSVFRFTDFRQVVFHGCNLTRADFQNANLSGAGFVDCDLSGAQFSHARMAGARFRGCELAGIGGVTSFAGAIIADQDILALAYTLAAGLGIHIEDGDES